MQIVIDIPEYIYKLCQGHGDIVYKYIAKGTPLPKGHGRLIDTNEITAFKELECNGHNVKSLDEFTVIIEADKEGDIYAD